MGPSGCPPSDLLLLNKGQSWRCERAGVRFLQATAWAPLVSPQPGSSPGAQQGRPCEPVLVGVQCQQCPVRYYPELGAVLTPDKGP